jgi:hypothetical protein
MLPGGSADTAVGAALLSALAGAREGLPDDQGTLRDDDNPVLKAAGVRRNAAFVREAAHILVSLDEDEVGAGGTVRIHPSRRGRGSFEYLPERSSLSSPAEPSALGAAVREAFARCEPPAGMLDPAMADENGSSRDGAGSGRAEAGDVPVVFGPNTAWLALRTDDPREVARALGLHEIAPVPWQEGVTDAVEGDDLVFVTPPVDGWVLAVGAVLGSWGPLEIGGQLSALSRTLTEAHYYVTRRSSDYAAWGRAMAGRTVRVFAYADDEMLSEGALDAFERTLGITTESRTPEEGDVFRMAAAWSVDPMTFGEREAPQGPGLSGRLG